VRQFLKIGRIVFEKYSIGIIFLRDESHAKFRVISAIVDKSGNNFIGHFTKYDILNFGEEPPDDSEIFVVADGSYIDIRYQ
jgi:hypothetical protein